MRMAGNVVINEEVAAALETGQGVVALESTIIAHGMPYPENLETALAVEEVVRRAGAVPATIAVLDGRARVGCSRADLEDLARNPARFPKSSLRDLPVLAARGLSGATTVAATAAIAAQAGITVFATGGIGGVHRGWAGTLDISADLEVLAWVPLVVVSSGAKSVLDVAATLEFLETKGVTVLGYRTDRFPGFYVGETPHGVDARVEEPGEAAAIATARRKMGLPGAVLVAVPVPAADGLPPAILEGALERALAAAAAGGVKGKALTPFLLEAIKNETGGRSLAANIALIKNNATVGAAIAVELVKALS